MGKGALTPVSIDPSLEPGTLRDTSDSVHQGASSMIKRSASEEQLLTSTLLHNAIYSEYHPQRSTTHIQDESASQPERATSVPTKRSVSPPLLSANDAVNRAKSLSKKLSMSQIPTHVTDNGDLMLDMKGYKSSEDEALRAEVVARKILSEELEGDYDIGALIGADEQGNLWIYSSEEAKEAAGRKIGMRGLVPEAVISDAVSDPGYHSDEDTGSAKLENRIRHLRTQSASTPTGLATPPQTPPAELQSGGDSNRSYAKTLRLTSDQLKAMNLKPGENSMSFSVNRATCEASMYYWTYDVPIVISDIDGTITK